jgi:hypothetical protein
MTLVRRALRGIARAALCARCLVLVVEPALAREETLPFRVEFVSAEACTQTDGFSHQLLRRTERVRRANPEDDALVFRIEVERDGNGFTGRLAVRELDGSQTYRSVSGASCDEVVSAMALIAAVLVDPNASSEALSDSSSESDAALHESTAAPAAAATLEPAPRAEPVPPSPAREPRKTHESSTRVAYGGGVAIAFEGAAAPAGTPALALELEAALERDSPVSPLLVLSLERAFPKRSTTPNGVARFQWTAFRASGCPLRVSAGSAWVVRPCAFFEFGELAASGEHTERRSTTEAPWLALGGILRIEFSPAPPLFLVLDGGLAAPLRHDTFYFDPPSPRNTAFTVPVVGATARLGIVTRID